MPEKDQKSKLLCTTGKAYFSKSSSPKHKYIQDPSDFVDNNYKNDYSQFLIPYDVLTLEMIPIWGSYSGQQIEIHYDWDNIQLVINGKENADVMQPLKPGTSPDGFTRFAMALIHSPTTQTDLCSTKTGIFQPASLVTHCLRSATIHIKSLPKPLTEYLPREFLGHFCVKSQISVCLNVWPSSEKLPRRIMVTARRGMVIAEFFWLIRYILRLNNQVQIRLFRRFLSLDAQDILSENDVIDCVINPRNMCRLTSDSRNGNKKFVLTKIGPTKFEISRKEVLVVSLVGKGIKEIPVSLVDSLTTLDQAIRQTFQLRQSTLLSFKHPNQESFLLQTGKVIKSQTDEEKVKNLITNKRRNFPACGSSGIPNKRLYKESPLYLKSLKSLGFYSGCFLEVFEVTGPTIPIMLFGEAIEPCAIDVNPAWNLELFLYYLRIFSRRDEKFANIDYVRSISDKKVSDILDMMGSLWWRDKRSSIAMTDRLEYLKVRV